jgi:threonine dehydrogenase-like Zn-dependent dehydrogenase
MIEATQRFNSGRLAPRVIECTGTEHGLQLAGELCDTRGRLIIAGYHQDGPRMVNMQMWNWRGLDVINAHERDPQVYMKGLRQAISAVSDGRLDPRPLHTHVFSLQQFSLAMDTAAKRPEGFMKALIRMDSGQEEGRSCASS